jgi:hypothetical protein
VSRPKSVPNWTYAAASRTLPYVSYVLQHLREGFIEIWHLYRIGGNNVNNPKFRDRIRHLADDGREAIAELDRLGVIAYQSPLRGIALFPFLVHEGKGRRRKAYYVFKDTRDSIDSFIFADDLCARNDLYVDERPIPAGWKVAGAIPTLIEGTTP